MKTDTNTSPFALYAILPSLFNANSKAVDIEAMKSVASQLVDAGIPDFLLTGAYGEFQSLEDDERVDIMKAVRSVAGVQHVMACAAHPATPATVALTQRLEAAGADTVMVAPPFGAEFNGAERVRHFNIVANAAERPITIYNNPVFGADISPVEFQQIIDANQIFAIKQGTKIVNNFIDTCVRARDTQTLVYAASDLSVSATLSAGADGLTSTNSGVFPQTMHSVAKAARQGDFVKVQQIADALVPYKRLCAKYGQPHTVKAGLFSRGIIADRSLRAPYEALDEDALKQVSEAIRKSDANLNEISL